MELINEKINRRCFLKSMAGTAMGAWLFNWFPSIAEAAVEIQYLRQLVTEDISTSRTIMWQTRSPQPEARLQYRRTEGEINILRPVIKEFTDNDHTTYIYSITINGLNPGMEYEYRVSCKGNATPWYPIHTPTEDEISKLLIFPDSQSADGYVKWRNTAEAAFAQHRDAMLAVNMGDLVDNGEAFWQWTQWQDGIDSLWKSIPFVPVMGNHECYDINWKCRLPKAYLALFALPGNKSTAFSKYYYSFDAGPVHYIVLNTMWEELKGLNDGIIAEQMAWLAQDAAQTHKKWKVVLMHKDIINYDDPTVWRSPAYPENKPDRGGGSATNPAALPESKTLADIDTVGKTFMPYFDKYGIDAVLTAHMHTYRRHDHIYGFQPSDHGPVYFCTGVAGDSYYNVPFTRRFDKKYLPQPEYGNYMTIVADKESLKFACYLPDGRIMDSYVLKG